MAVGCYCAGFVVCLLTAAGGVITETISTAAARLSSVEISRRDTLYPWTVLVGTHHVRVCVVCLRDTGRYKRRAAALLFRARGD